MNLLDRILLILASFCLSAIFVIFFSGELSSSDSEPEVRENNLEQEYLKASSDDDMIVYSQEIDEVINQYFRTLKKNPEIDEEEKRLVDEVFTSIPTRKQSKPKLKKASQNLITKHIVRQGESLWRISNKYGVPLYTIISANPKKASQVIHPGDVLRIPTKQGILYKIKKGDNLSRISKKYKISVQSIKKSNKMRTTLIRPGKTIFLPGAKPLPKTRYAYRRKFVWPIRGRVTSGYGWRRHPVHKKKHFHRGVDIGAKRGTRIRAISKGVVIYAGKSGGYGRLVILRHKGGYLSAYAHCSKIYVKKGSVVRRSQTIARVGSSGLATGSHLHFEIKRFQKNVNPVSALRKKVKVPIS